MWFEHGFITNLYPDSGKQAWASDGLHMDIDGRIVWTPIDLDLTVPADTLTLSQAQARIIDMLDATVTKLEQPVRLFCSGGLDTALIYSLLRYHRCDIDLVADEHFETNKFVDMNQLALEHYWSYRRGQLHHWNQPTWLATGGCGDEYLLRGPAVIALLTAWHDIDFAARLAQDQYHYYHFAKYQSLWQDTWHQRHQLREQYPDTKFLHAHVLNTLLNDHQHWHLGNTVTWTPLKNIELARTLLQVDIDKLIPQFLNGDFTRSLIAQYCAPVLEFVSSHKNHQAGQHRQAFWNWHHA